MKKYFLLAFLVTVFSFLVSCGSKTTPTKVNNTQTPPTTQTGEANFKKHCSACHGMDGNMGIGGAKKLPESVLSVDERMQIITNGKNTMPEFGSKLSEQERKDVATYTTTLK